MPEVALSQVAVSRTRTRTYDVNAEIPETINALIDLITPTGSIIPVLSDVEPGNGWKICNGQVLIKAEFPRLYAVLSGRVAETETTFTLPDLRGRTMIGAGDVALGALGGSATITLAVEQLPAHSHTVTDPGHSHTVTDPGHVHASIIIDPDAAEAAAGTPVDSVTPGDTESAVTGVSVEAAETGIAVEDTGDGEPIDILPPYLAINWMVRT